MLVLNENIHEFDKKENKKRKLHNVFEWIWREIYLIDERLFEKSYKEELEESNILISKLTSDLLKKENKIKKLQREIIKLEKSVKKNG